MSDTPDKCPNDPKQNSDRQDIEDFFCCVLLWVFRIAFFLMVIKTIVNFTKLF